LAAACRRLGLAVPERGTAQLFAGPATGWVVRLPGWTYPAVFDTEAGSVAFDTFNGTWGSQDQLDRLLQAYACEKAKLEARRVGHAVTEQPLPDGSIRLTIAVGGGA
jgi:hypothetical protein